MSLTNPDLDDNLLNLIYIYVEFLQDNRVRTNDSMVNYFVILLDQALTEYKKVSNV